MSQTTAVWFGLRMSVCVWLHKTTFQAKLINCSQDMLVNSHAGKLFSSHARKVFLSQTFKQAKINARIAHKILSHLSCYRALDRLKASVLTSASILK